MKVRVLYNYVLVRLGIRQVLPIDYIKKVKAIECGEPMARIRTNQIVFFDDTQTMMARECVIAKLENVASCLERDYGLYLRIFELYRSPEKQQKMRERYIQLLRHGDSSLAEEQIQSEVNKRVSAIGGGHQTGGAVDLCLCDKDGKMLDMGTDYDEFNAFTPTKSKGLNPVAKNNREILVKYMQREGFVNYPNEWWHFSYGDKMWAAYKWRKYAIYDVV